jgi:thioredoxin 1
VADSDVGTGKFLGKIGHFRLSVFQPFAYRLPFICSIPSTKPSIPIATTGVIKVKMVTYIRKNLKQNHLHFMTQSVTELNFTERVLLSSTPVLVNFGAPWCGLCKLIQPTLTQFEYRWDDQIKVVDVNADDHLKLASTYRLKTLPTLILFANGKVVDRLEGFHSREDLAANLDRMARVSNSRWQICDQMVPMQIAWSLAAIDS